MEGKGFEVLMQLKKEMDRETTCNEIRHIDNRFEQNGENKINNNEQQIEVRRKGIYWANIDGNIGSEQGGKCYPVICLSNDIGNKFSPTIIVAFITSKLDKPKLPTHVSIEGYGLPKNSVALLEQVRTIDKRRLVGYVGTIDEITMKRIDNAKNISMSELKQKTTFERLSLEHRQYIVNKLNVIRECNTVLKFLTRINGSKKDIDIAEDEKFEAENALMSFCYEKGLNCDEFYTQENGINEEIAL